MIRRTRLRSKGARTLRWEKWEDATRRQVRENAGYACQGCGKPDRSGDPMERHHVFGRPSGGAHLGDVWCHHPALGVWLCVSYRGVLGCHAKAERGVDPDLVDLLEREAYAAFANAFDRSPRIPRGYTAIQAIRRLVTQLENQGWRYDADTNTLVRGKAA